MARHIPEFEYQIMRFEDTHEQFRVLKSGGGSGYPSSYENYWTDGNTETSSQSQIPSLLKEILTSRYFWIDETIVVQEYKYCPLIDGDKDPHESIPLAQMLTDEELFQALDLGKGSTPQKEAIIRQRIWWMDNDRLRPGHPIHKKSIEYLPLSARHSQNLKRLVHLLLKHEGILEDQELLIPEIYRELSDFESADDMLLTIYKSGLSDWHNAWFLKIEELIRAKNPFVAEFDGVMIL